MATPLFVRRAGHQYLLGMESAYTKGALRANKGSGVQFKRRLD